MSLQCLCVVMELLHKVSCGVGNSLMDASNLAVVMAPNLLRTSKDIRDLHDNTLRVQQSACMGSHGCVAGVGCGVGGVSFLSLSL